MYGDVLTPLSKLQGLDLSNNNISYLPQLSWASNVATHTIDLRGNPLDAVDETPFANLFILTNVLVDEPQCEAGTMRKPVTLLGGSGSRLQMCVGCSPGSYCPDGLQALQCERGTYSGVAQAFASDTCK